MSAISMSISYPMLESLISTLVPETRVDSRLKRELLAQCQDILSSHIGHGQDIRDADINSLVDKIKRHLSPSGPASVKFTNLLSRLLDQHALSRKYASILFLYRLASSGSHVSQGSTIASIMQAIPPPSSHRSNISNPTESVVSPRSQVKSKAMVLQEYRAKSGYTLLPEADVVRDALYILQGISGKYVGINVNADGNSDNALVFVNDNRHSLMNPTKALLYRLSEVGYLYIRIQSFIQDRESNVGVGMIEQSLCHYLQSQLTQYYRLIAIMESHMATNLEQAPGADSTTLQGHPGLTLRRLDAWINDWRLRLRMMSVCVEGARTTHGGALVNLIHGYSENGDPFIRRFTDHLLEEVSKPFFATLHKWLFSGELHDPFSEFFVSIDTDIAGARYMNPSLMGDGGIGGFNADAEDASRAGGLQLWQTKYQFREDMLPMFLGEQFGRKILSTGKSLNFIRYSCHDSDWVDTREKMNNTGKTLKYSDIRGLERSIDAAYQIASQRLFDVFIAKFKLIHHLRALKQYLMLGHGDFAEQLMETLGPSLARPANTLFRHNLTATLETAIRSSNAQGDPPDVLRRLDARMLEYSHGEIGWDVFTLEYKVDAPLDTVLDPKSMEKYLKVFRHLWQMKRLERTLNMGWLRIVSGARTFLRIPELEVEWHKIRISMAEMIHVIRQMQAYSHLEVIECSWKVLMDFLDRREGDLDALINMHRTYLDRIVKKVLLLTSKTGKEESVYLQVKDLFVVMLQFKEATATDVLQDDFYNYCLTESARRDQLLDIGRGVYTATESDKAAAPDKLPTVLSRLNNYTALISERISTTVQLLQTHSDLDCRFLGVRLSFSDFYRSRPGVHRG